ncbi:MAG: RNA pseudouridine synthase [Elusimicrobia bacterium]|nr:RNA pseudouridine synthase [Elusimicrobiota bacterium]
MEIIYQNDQFLAINKPAGQIVIPGRGARERLSLKKEIADSLKAKIYVVHRLDTETSGLILFAKTAETHAELSRLFETRKVKKCYWAIVQGKIENAGSVDKPLKAFGSGRMGISPLGKPSQTLYQVKKLFKDTTWLEIQPLTGRRHQIRVHLYSLGHPILGETRYGPKQTEFPRSDASMRTGPISTSDRLMLHAYQLEFTLFSKKFTLTAPIPEDFLKILNSL